MSDAITKAVIALEKHHGVKSIMELPDRIINKWRKDHEQLFKESRAKSVNFFNDNDEIDEIYLKNKIDGTDYLSKIDIKYLAMAPVETTIQTSNAMYMKIAESMLKGNVQARDIAKDIGETSVSIKYYLPKVRTNFYYYFLADGRVFKANKINELEISLASNGINISPQLFYYYINECGGYSRFRNGNAYARAFIQYQITPITLMDDNGNVIKEV